jgi:hypothetical protein
MYGIVGVNFSAEDPLVDPLVQVMEALGRPQFSDRL